MTKSSMDLVWLYAAAVFALINTALIIVLLWLYFSTFGKVRSTFTVGLVVFVLFFLVQNVSIIVFWYQLFNLVPSASSIVEAASPYMTVINLFETVALASLVRVSMR